MFETNVAYTSSYSHIYELASYTLKWQKTFSAKKKKNWQKTW